MRMTERVVRSAASEPDIERPAADDAIDALFHAHRVAVIGASADANRPGGRTLRYLSRYGFTGAVHGVHPTLESAQGFPCVASIADVPGPVDVAVITLRAGSVAAAVEACGAAGVRVAIVYASGFAELDDHGAALQRELTATARRVGVRLIGPNSNGVVAAAAGLPLTFMSGIDDPDLTLRDDGAVFLSQSGAMGAFILQQAQASGFGLGRFVSTGNEADLSMAELLAAVVNDTSTRVVLLYLEGIADPIGLGRALDRARSRSVPVVVMKVGRSAAGARAAASHTGALAGSDEVLDGFLAQHGAIRAHTIDQLLDHGRMLTHAPRPVGDRISIITLSGGAGVLATDAAEDHALRVPAWDGPWREQLAQVLPAFAGTANPIDVTGALLADTSLLAKTLDVAVRHEGSDIVLVILGNMQTQEAEACAMITAAARATTKPVVTVWVGGTGRTPALLAEQGLAGFTEPVRAIDSLAALVRVAGVAGTPVQVDEHSVPRPQSSPKSPTPVTWDEVRSKELLARHGISTVAEEAVDDPDSAAAAAARLGWPVVVKFLSAQVAHKSDLGLVELGLTDEEQVRSVARGMLARAPQVADRRLVVQAMVAGQTELILGMKRDPVFGPVVLLGVGGVLAEVTADVQVRVPPLSLDDAHSMMDTLAHASVLDGVRGRPATDRNALARLICLFAEASVATELESVEANPVLINQRGMPVVVDALAVERTG